jgi:hypothetical protein
MAGSIVQQWPIFGLCVAVGETDWQVTSSLSGRQLDSPEATVKLLIISSKFQVPKNKGPMAPYLLNAKHVHCMRLLCGVMHLAVVHSSSAAAVRHGDLYSSIARAFQISSRKADPIDTAIAVTSTLCAQID